MAKWLFAILAKQKGNITYHSEECGIQYKLNNSSKTLKKECA